MKDKDIVIVDNMAPGEKELRQTFEETTTKNVRTVIDFTQDTRKMFRELEEKVERLQRQAIVQNETISRLTTQLAYVQAKVHDGNLD